MSRTPEPEIGCAGRQEPLAIRSERRQKHAYCGSTDSRDYLPSIDIVNEHLIRMVTGHGQLFAIASERGGPYHIALAAVVSRQAIQQFACSNVNHTRVSSAANDEKFAVGAERQRRRSRGFAVEGKRRNQFPAACIEHLNGSDSTSRSDKTIVGAVRQRPLMPPRLGCCRIG